MATEVPGAIVYECSVPGTVAITFDDGPYIYTKGILDMFNQANMKVTFFVNGNNWDCIYNYFDLIQAIDAAGHQIASHTYSHPDLLKLTQDEVADQMTLLEATLIDIIGKVPIFMRPPFGRFNSTVAATVESLGYIVVIWTQDSQDSVGAPFSQEKANYNGEGTKEFGASIPYNQTGQPGGSEYIFLNHDVQALTYEQLVAWVITWVQSRGLRAVTVGECLGMNQWYRNIRPRLSTAALSGTTCVNRPVY